MLSPCSLTQPLRCCPVPAGSLDAGGNQRPLHGPEGRVSNGTCSWWGGCEHTFPFKAPVLCARV